MQAEAQARVETKESFLVGANSQPQSQACVTEKEDISKTICVRT